MKINNKTTDGIKYTHLKEANLRISKMGYEFDFNAERWEIDGSTIINFGRLRTLDEATAFGLRSTLCRYAEELAGVTTANAFTNFNSYCDSTGEKAVSVYGLSKWRSMLCNEDEWVLGSLKAFFSAWKEWGFPGVENEVIKYLEELTLRGNSKGKAVKRGCMYSGPLSDLELGSLLSWASSAFQEESLELIEYAFFLVIAFTGRRAVQVRSLRSGDLMFREGSDGNEYVINIPRAKQKGGGFRQDFNPLFVNEDLYLVLENQAIASKNYVEKSLGKKLPKEIQKKIPIFLAEERITSFLDIQTLERTLEEKPDFFHMTETTALRVLRNVSIKNMAMSERTGEIIQFTARRFRYTKATNLARRGISGIELAFALDHSDTQNIDVYTQNTPEMAVHIDAVMAPILAPLAKAFAGRLIESERDALRAKDPHSRVKNNKAENIGSCGSYVFCASGFRACYTCPNFQPWLDAPHENALKEIQEERKRQIEVGVSSYVIQATDSLLLAIEQVIALCKELNNKGKTGAGNV